MLQRRADVVEALQQNFLARRGDLKLEHKAVFVSDGLVWQIDRERIAFFFFRALEEFFDFILRQRRGQDAVLETVVVENVRVTRRDDHAEAVVLDTPGEIGRASCRERVEMGGVNSAVKEKERN